MLFGLSLFRSSFYLALSPHSCISPSSSFTLISNDIPLLSPRFSLFLSLGHYCLSGVDLVLSCVVCSLSLSLLFRSLSFLTSLVISSRFSIYVSLSSSRFSLYRPLSLISHHPLLSFPISYLLSLSSLYSLCLLLVLPPFSLFMIVDAKCETLRIIHPLWDGACLRRTDTILNANTHTAPLSAGTILRRLLWFQGVLI